MEYLAGFIDGEGCIQVFEDRVYLEISHTYLEVLTDIHREFGGILCGPYKRCATWKPQWKWRVSGLPARPLLLQLLPHLREKRRQVEIMLEWMDSVPRGEKRGLLKRLCSQAKKTQHDTHATD